MANTNPQYGMAFKNSDGTFGFGQGAPLTGNAANMPATVPVGQTWLAMIVDGVSIGGFLFESPPVTTTSISSTSLSSTSIPKSTVTFPSISTSKSTSTTTSTPTTSSIHSSSTNFSTTFTTATTVSSNSSNTNGAGINVKTTGVILPGEIVAVDCHSSTFTNDQLLQSQINWNFGDPSSGELNYITGFNAAHTYATLGSYTITLTITLSNGQTSTTSVNISISADIRKIVNLTSGQNILPASNQDIILSAGSYNAFSLAGLSHVRIRATTGALVTINGSVPSIITTDSKTSSCIVQGLNITSQNGSSDGCDLSGTGIVFENCTFTHLTNCFNLNSGPSNVLIQNCIVPDGSPTTTATTIDSYFVWVQGTNINIYSNTVNNTISQAIVRLGGATVTNYCIDINISYNNFTKTTPSDQSYKNCISAQWEEYVTIYENTLTNGPCQVASIGDPTVNDPTAAFSYYVIVSSNKLINSKIDLGPQTTNTFVYNNVISAPDTQWCINVTATEGAPFNWQIKNLFIDHNTGFQTTKDGGFLFLGNGEMAGTNTLTNNVYQNPNLVLGENQSAVTYNSNNDNTSWTTIAGNIWDKNSMNNATIWSNGGIMVIGNEQTTQAAWISPANWISKYAPTDTFIPVVFSSTYSINGKGSNLNV